MIFRHKCFYVFLWVFLFLLWPEWESVAQRRLQDLVDPIQDLDREAGEAFLEEFRSLGTRADYSFKFSLRTMPRRGPERYFDGRMWGSRNRVGPITLIEIREREETDNRVRLLVQNGREAAVWKAVPGPGGLYEVTRVGVEDWFTPVMGTDYTVFDLQMPFIFWDDFDYEGVFRVRGRPCHVFNMNPPGEFAKEHSSPASIRMFLDAEFKALFRAESVNPEEEVERTFSVLDFKKVQDEWIVKTIDLRDDESLDKTRFQVNHAAMDLSLPASVFDPDNLGGRLPSVDSDRLSRVN